MDKTHFSSMQIRRFSKKCPPAAAAAAQRRRGSISLRRHSQGAEAGHRGSVARAVRARRRLDDAA